MNSKIILVLGFIAVAAIVEASAAPQEELEVPKLMLLPPRYEGFVHTLCRIGDDQCVQQDKQNYAATKKAYVSEMDQWIATLDGPSKATWEQDFPKESQYYRKFSG
ncbi:unnamed protein product [Orchesella dallaii]|uniref:Uncharacterized protein n=1 Tax=Orchesella dallaii TaxID=48710 RepID=A0ABP1RQ04_9HEXA